MAGSFREFQPPCRARRARDCAPYRARFLASSNDTFGPLLSFASARQQVRCATCQVKEHYIPQEEHTFPRRTPKSYHLLPPRVNCPRPAQTGTRCRTRGAKTQIPHRAANPARNPHITLYICSEQIYVIENLLPRSLRDLGHQATRREADIESETARSTRTAPDRRNETKCSRQRLYTSASSLVVSSWSISFKASSSESRSFTGK